MAAVSNIAKHRLTTQDFDWLGTDIGVMIISGIQATDRDLNFVNLLQGELSGPGYERKTLANKTLVRDDVEDITVLSADALLWTAIDAGQADRLVLFEDSGSDSTSRVISYHLVRNSNGNPITTNGGDLPYEPHAVFGYLSVMG